MAVNRDFYAGSPWPKRPPGHQRVIANRRLMAERIGWPPGAFEAVLAIERDCPGYRAAWFPELRLEKSVEFNRAEGFYAWLAGDQPGELRGLVWCPRPEWYGATAEELRKQLGG